MSNRLSFVNFLLGVFFLPVCLAGALRSPRHRSSRTLEIGYPFFSFAHKDAKVLHPTHRLEKYPCQVFSQPEWLNPCAAGSLSVRKNKCGDQEQISSTPGSSETLVDVAHQYATPVCLG